MPLRSSLYLAVIIAAAVCCSTPMQASESARALAKQAAEKALEFLDKDADQWKKDHRCSTCHQGTMTMWMMNEAKGLGYPVNAEKLAEMNRTTFGEPGALMKFGIIINPVNLAKVPAGFDTVSLSAFNIAMASRSISSLDSISSKELEVLDRDILKHQLADGSWANSPPANGPPPVFESVEVVTLRLMLALEVSHPSDSTLASSIQEALHRANTWLKQNKSSNTTQAIALKMLVDVQAGRSGRKLDSGRRNLLKKQNPDGGWSPANALPSDAYATGMALYALSQAGTANSSSQIERAQSYLITTQRPDGSWPMTPRAHPGNSPFKNPSPITYFGSGWAALGLLRSAPVS